MQEGRRSRFFLYNFKSYWRLRAWSLDLRQKLQINEIERKRSFANYKISTWIGIQVLRSALKSFVFVIVLFYVVEKSDSAVTHAIKWIAEHFGMNISQFKDKIDPNFLASFVGTIAQIAGIFLGLYYAAVGVVVSTAYAQFPNKLRQLLLSERIGSLYIKSTAFLAAWALLTLTLRGVGYETSRLGYFCLCLIIIFSVLSFVKFGTHVFNLYDLRLILNEPRKELEDIIQRISICTRDADTLHKVSHFRAKDILQVFEDIVTVASRKEFDRGKTINEILLNLLSLLSLYAVNKGKISSKSPWFPTTNQHQSWLTADASHIATSLHTGTMLLPSRVTDFNWFETAIFKIVKHAFQLLLKVEDGTSYSSAILIVSNTSCRLVEGHAIDEAIQLIKVITSVIDDFIQAEINTKQLAKADQLPAYLAQLEFMHCLLYTELPISFGKGVRQISDEKLGDVAGHILSSQGTLRGYTVALPRVVLDEIHRISELLVFECKSEDKPVTKKWYIQQILGLATARHIEASLKKIHQALTDFYGREPDKEIGPALIEYRCYRLMGAIEALEKFIVHLDFSQWSYDSIKKGRRATDIPFIEIEFDSLCKSTSTLRSKVIDRLALNAIIIGYSSKTRSPDTPDFFGQAYFLCLEECRGALKKGDEERFKSIFPTTFGLAWFAYTAVEKELKGQSDKIRIIYTTEVLEEIMSLSGLAYIYSELDQKEFFKPVEEIWNKHFDSVPDKAAFANYLFACISYRKSEFGLMPRAIIRSGWDQELSHEFRKRGLLEDDFSFHRHRRANETQKHTSKIIRVLSRSSFAIHNTIEVFVCLYLLKRSEIVNIDLPQSVKAFQESLEREEGDED